MKIKDDRYLMKYVNEYIKLCIAEGYYNSNMAGQFYEKIVNMNRIYDDSIPGDAYRKGHTLYINRKRTFYNDRKASSVLFHEFTHICSSLNEDMFNDYSLLKKFKNYMERNINTDYQFGYESTKCGDVNNPYTYFIFGALLLDEVTSENVALQLISRKYNEPRAQYVQKTKPLGHLRIYKVLFKYGLLCNRTRLIRIIC